MSVTKINAISFEDKKSPIFPNCSLSYTLHPVLRLELSKRKNMRNNSFLNSASKSHIKQGANSFWLAKWKKGKHVTKGWKNTFFQTVDKCFVLSSTEFGLETWFRNGKLKCSMWDMKKSKPYRFFFLMFFLTIWIILISLFCSSQDRIFPEIQY